MAEAGVSFLLDNVKLLALHQIELYRNAKKEFELLEHELNAMKEILEKAARNPREEEGFNAWERRVREVVYDAEDTIDSWITEGNSGFSYLTLRTTIGGKVRDLRKNKVKPAFETAISDFAKIPKSETRGRVDDIRDSVMKPPRSDNVVGLEDQINLLVDYIYENVKELDVISIIGMPGLGKTTVAGKVYNHPRIEHDFAIRIWVYVSQDFNKKEILLKILKTFTMEDLSTESEVELVSMVKNKLAKQRFLLFLDDVWTEGALKQLLDILPMDNCNGKVLITSRSVTVGNKSNKERAPHMLRFLNEKESLELLQIEAFGGTNGFPDILVPTCKLIAKQCGGLPLAIIVIGGVLADKRSPGESGHETRTKWESVSASVKTHLIQGDDEKRMEKFISLSYTSLPYHLKDCFLYMGLFPEDAEISAWKLKQMWIAEGFILLKPGKSLEEVADENLKELINRNLVQVDKIKPNGEVKICRLHDTIQEFCKNEAALRNLFQEISRSKEGPLQPSIEGVKKCRRLCIHSGVEDILVEYFTKNKVSKARALLCFSKDPIILANRAVANIINASDMIRVLEMSTTIKFNKFPTKVSQLIHLRYISLSAGQLIKILPPDLDLLWNLQTIIVTTFERTLTVKANLWKMVQLRHFKTRASVTLKGEGGKGGNTLQTLSNLSPESCTEDVFKKAKNLITLGIRGDLDKVVFNANSFVSLEKLEKLKLFHDVEKSAKENPWRSFPSVDRFPTHLKSLTLKNTYLEWTHMSFMGRLHTLEVLKLKEHAFEGNYWHRADSSGFARLAFLHMEQLNIVVWDAPAGSFPDLKSLVIKNCEDLEAVPPHVCDNLSMMYLECVSTSILNSAKDIAAKKNAGLRIPEFKLIVKTFTK